MAQQHNSVFFAEGPPYTRAYCYVDACACVIGDLHGSLSTFLAASFLAPEREGLHSRAPGVQNTKGPTPSAVTSTRYQVDSTARV